MHKCFFILFTLMFKLVEMSSSHAMRLTSRFRPFGVALASSCIVMSRGNFATATPGNTCPNGNPLMDKSSLPKFDQIKPVHVVPALTEDLNHLKTEFDSKCFWFLLTYVYVLTANLFLNRIGRFFEGI